MSRRIVTRRKGGFSDAVLLPVSSLAQLSSIASTDVADKAFIYVKDADKLFRFSYESVAAANGVSIIAPDVGPGRWHAISGLGSGGNAYGVKNESFLASGFTYNGGTGLSTKTLGDTSTSTDSVQGLKILAKGGLLNMKRVIGTPANVGEFSISGATLSIYGDITASGDTYTVFYPVEVNTAGLIVRQEVLLASAFTYNGGTGLSTKTLTYETATDVNLQGLKMLAKGGLLNMKRVSGTPAATGEFNMTGFVLSIHGDITASGDTYLAIYPTV